MFGNMFNNITLLRMSSDGATEVQRIKVPCEHAPKDKYVVRLNNDPDFQRQVQSILPRMSYEMVDMAYDPTRRQNMLLKQVRGKSSSGVSSQFTGAPYNIGVELSVLTKTIDDGDQIVGQILPYFSPDYTVTMSPVAELPFLKDFAIILDSVNRDITYEGNWESTRTVLWTLKFTIKAYFFGPVFDAKIIKKSIVNIFNDPSLVAGYVVKANLGSGNGVFQIDDTVYQGDNFQSASAYGIVIRHNPDIQHLTLSGAQGQFIVGGNIKGMSSNASYSIASFDATPIKLVEIIIEPDPLNATPNSNYGYTETLSEWPETEPE